MKTLESSRTIAALIAHVVSECKPVDREERFEQMLDECYSFEKVGGPFENMLPSQVLKECDPTAFRCGVNDWADSEPWTEIEGETYADEDIETARTEFVDGLNDELSDLQAELEEAEEDEDEVRDVENVNRLTAEIDALTGFIAEVEKYEF
jgi:hypothetical protein